MFIVLLLLHNLTYQLLVQRNYEGMRNQASKQSCDIEGHHREQHSYHHHVN
jgi:hypothetical protein